MGQLRPRLAYMPSVPATARAGGEGMIGIDPNEIRCDLAEEGAALGLIGIMTGISEENWCAGWLSGLEYELWRFATGERTGSFGMNQITERQATLLRLLSEECNGWWIYQDTAGPKFIRLEWWRAHLDAQAAKTPASGADRGEMR